jgi:hypothetical protein
VSVPAWPVVRICACGGSYESHDIDTKAKRRIGPDGSAVVCAGFRLERTESYPPRSEYARRLAAVVEVVGKWEPLADGWWAESLAEVRAAASGGVSTTADVAKDESPSTLGDQHGRARN